MTEITDRDREALIERLRKGEFYVLTSTGPKHCGEQAADLIQSTTAMAAEIERLKGELAQTNAERFPDMAGQLSGLAAANAVYQLEIDQLRREKAAAVELLEWYGEQARLARLIHSEGDAGRQALLDDGGKRARTFLGQQEQRT